MASVIARGTLISPGFSRPSVIWCMLRLHGRRGGNGGVEGWGWSEQSGLTTMHGGTRATRTDALTDMHTCVWMFTKTLIPAFLFSPSKRPQGAAVKASRARTHARTHVCMQCFFFTLILCLNLCFSEALSCRCTISLENISTKGIAAIKGSSEPTDPHGAEKGHFGWWLWFLIWCHGDLFFLVYFFCCST